MQLRLVWLIFISLLLSACASLPPPRHSENICKIFYQYPKWKRDTLQTQHNWGVPIAVQMSIIFQESSYKSHARPRRQMLFGIVPWFRPTTAYGYCQAIDPTWRLYQRETYRYTARRNNFADASEFIGWYASRAHRRAKIPVNNAYYLYLAYHEGITNFMHGTHLSKPWLLKTARRVQARADSYQAQLNQCRY